MLPMFGCILIATTLASFARAQDDEIAIFDSDNKTVCINKLLEWCNGMKYPQQGVGMTMLSVTFEDPSGYYRVYCVSDMDGTNCTRNGMPWFACSSSNVLSYKGKVLANNSTDVDDDICNAADKAFNDLLVQNLSYENTTMKEEVEKGMEAFFEAMAEMQEQIDQIRKMLNFNFGFSDTWGGFFGKNPQSDSTTMTPSDTRQTSTEQSNQIEKE